ncbi:MAG: hypothetical protein ACI9ZF_001572 [Bradyrhizobium sp.]|jgi:hypothetical protein
MMSGLFQQTTFSARGSRIGSNFSALACLRRGKFMYLPKSLFAPAVLGGTYATGDPGGCQVPCEMAYSLLITLKNYFIVLLYKLILFEDTGSEILTKYIVELKKFSGK